MERHRYTDSTIFRSFMQPGINNNSMDKSRKGSVIGGHVGGVKGTARDGHAGSLMK